MSEKKHKLKRQILRLKAKKEKETAKGVVSTNDEYNRYAHPEHESNSIIFEGWSRNDNGSLVFNEDSHLACSIIKSIASMSISKILWGKTSRLVEEDFRQYEFNLNSISNFKLCFLYVKGNEHWFTHQDCFKIVDNGSTQKIPITYQTLTAMTEEESAKVYWDFD